MRELARRDRLQDRSQALGKIGGKLRPPPPARHLDVAALEGVLHQHLAERDVAGAVDAHLAVEHGHQARHPAAVLRVAVPAGEVEEAERAGRRLVRGRPRMSRSVGRTSVNDTAPRHGGAGRQRARQAEQHRHADASSRALRRWPRPPCSKNSSPWSDTTTTSVLSADARVSSACRMRPTCESTHATSPSYSAKTCSRSRSLMRRITPPGRSGSGTETHGAGEAVGRRSPCPCSRDRTSGRTAAAGRSRSARRRSARTRTTDCRSRRTSRIRAMTASATASEVTARLRRAVEVGHRPAPAAASGRRSAASRLRRLRRSTSARSDCGTGRRLPRRAAP